MLGDGQCRCRDWQGKCNAHAVHVHVHAQVQVYTLVQVHGAYLPHLGEFGVEEARREAAELKVGREHLVRVRVRVRVRVHGQGQG